MRVPNGEQGRLSISRLVSLVVLSTLVVRLQSVALMVHLLPYTQYSLKSGDVSCHTISVQDLPQPEVIRLGSASAHWLQK